MSHTVMIIFRLKQCFFSLLTKCCDMHHTKNILYIGFYGLMAKSFFSFFFKRRVCAELLLGLFCWLLSCSCY